MLIHTIIVTYNAMPWIDRCLSSLRNSTVASVPIIIDNKSADGTVEYVSEKYLEAVVLPQQKNLGFGQANNVGFRYALEHKADYVLLLNQDAALHPEALELLLAQSDGKSLLSPIHLNGDGTRLDYNFKRNTLLKSSQINTLFDDLLLDQEKRQYEIDIVCAACWLLPLAVVRAIGGFDPLFFHYGEDENYLQRLKYHGIRRIVVPQALMYHAREQQGNMKVFWSKIARRRFMMDGADINLNFKWRLRAYLRILKDCYLNYLPAGRYVIGSLTWYIISTWPAIRKSRKINKKKGMNWL